MRNIKEKKLSQIVGGKKHPLGMGCAALGWYMGFSSKLRKAYDKYC